MEFNPRLLEVIVCPHTHLRLRLPTPAEVEQAGSPEILVRVDGRAAYPVREGIPSLLLEDRIEFEATPENGDRVDVSPN